MYLWGFLLSIIIEGILFCGPPLDLKAPKVMDKRPWDMSLSKSSCSSLSLHLYNVETRMQTSNVVCGVVGGGGEGLGKCELTKRLPI